MDLKSELKKKKETHKAVFLVEYPKKCKSFFFLDPDHYAL